MDESSRINCVAAQDIDVDQKIKLSITESVRLLRHAQWTVVVASPMVFASTVTTPTISRLLCTNVMRCFGFLKVEVANVGDILSAIVWRNLAKFMAQTVGQSVLVWGGVVALTLFTVVGGILLAIGAPLMEILLAARMIIKCACDLIIILDIAFNRGSKSATAADIREASKEYTHKQRSDDGMILDSTIGKVHKEVEALIPIVSHKFYKPLQISKLQAGMEDIIN
jgi:hypothetical protein